ncbi:MAG: hypothetical protein ABI678_02395 [Kofleriaceae bacterium]
MKLILRGLVVGLIAACTTANPAATCGDGSCTDPNFPYCDATGEVSGEVGTCVAVTCEPGEIKACVQEQALACVATGNGYELLPCELGCSESPSPHCKYLQPRYLPNVCDQGGSTDTLSLTTTGTIDPNLDPICTGGVFDQAAAPDVCIVHHRSISISPDATVSVAGKMDATGRSIAFVADDDLIVEGILDVSGHARNNGPGGGSFTSGTPPGSMTSDSLGGGGGAGGATAGAAGGLRYSAGGGVDGGGSLGGMATANPALLAEFRGGGSSGSFTDASSTAVYGGGGGAVMLISCHGTVQVSGTVNAGGGGGVGGSVVIINTAGWGGGAGGVVSIEGPHVSITGSLYANGGGGGAGSFSGPVSDGEDGSMSDTVAAKGGFVQSAGDGGAGGIVGHAPSVGLKPSQTGASPGGGGGSVGFLQVFAPSGTTPTITPAHVSPVLPPVGPALTR